MTSVVLDTDVVSFLFKNDTRAQSYLPHLRDRQWLISFMTEAELEQWALLSSWHPKRIEWLRVFLRRFVIVSVFSRPGPQMGGSDGDGESRRTEPGNRGRVERRH